MSVCFFFLQLQRATFRQMVGRQTALPCRVPCPLHVSRALEHTAAHGVVQDMAGPFRGAGGPTLRPASLLCRFISVRAFCLISRASTNTLANPIPYLMSAEQPPHFHPSSLWYCPCFSLSQPQSLRFPCVQAAVMAWATPAAMMA